MTRLDNQRPPALGRTHKRLSARNDTRGYDIVPHVPWGDSQKVSPQRSAATNGDVFIEQTVTAQDTTNANKLGPLGYIAVPTSNWTSGQKITVSGFLFNWNGSAWAAGAHA
jgi:hypothetical protein